MSANVRLITPNLSDLVTMTVSPAAVATLLVTNLQNQTRARLWRSTSAAAQTIYGDWASNQTLSSVVLARSNLSTGAELTLKLYSGAGQSGSLLYDSTAQTKTGNLDWGYRDFGWWFTPTSGVRSFSLKVDDTANDDGYVEASRLVLGTYFEPVRNMSYGLALDWKEDSKQERTEGGTLRTDGKSPFRGWSFHLGRLTETERASILSIARNVGVRDDLYLSCFPDASGNTERDYAGVVKIVQLPKLVYDIIDNFNTDLVFEEA